MKTNILGLLIFMGGVLLSCDMDKYPYNSLPTGEAVRPGNLSDITTLRNGCFTYLRGLFTGDQVIAAEIQADGLHAVAGYTNTYGNFYNWSYTGSGVGPWPGIWTMINQCNFFLQKADELMDTYTTAQQATVKTYKGEAYFLRALAFEQLTLRYCVDYEPSTAASSLGIPIKLTYELSPSQDYMARASLEDTYKHMVSELDSAAKYVTATFTAGSPAPVTKEAIKALRARILLQAHKYSEAAALAGELIGGYPLVPIASAEQINNFTAMWKDDKSNETIFQAEGVREEAGSFNATGLYLLDKANNGETDNPDFIPSGKILDLYDFGTDIRTLAYFEDAEITTPQGTATLTVCIKYPGNPALYTEKTNYKNKPKILRMAEVYLVGAEAAYMAGQEGVANQWLNGLRKARIVGYVDGSYSGTALRDQIRTERLKEMYLEGQRLWDLKRYGTGLERRDSDVQDPTMTYLFGNSLTTALTVAADYYKFTWPVPIQEKQTNSNFIQNPEY
ncbi:MAG: RagB/SusD family nutrient uptake outer membrane protein [Culturomica sp.]|nr:RagB/SusD family nutrient uptake outer membrane protein [Culturomica sp.]